MEAVAAAVPGPVTETVKESGVRSDHAVIVHAVVTVSTGNAVVIGSATMTSVTVKGSVVRGSAAIESESGNMLPAALGAVATKCFQPFLPFNSHGKYGAFLIGKSMMCEYMFMLDLFQYSEIISQRSGNRVVENNHNENKKETF